MTDDTSQAGAAAAMAAALAGAYVLRFQLRSALMNGAFGDEGIQPVARAMCDDLHGTIAEGVALYAGLGGSVPGSLGAVVRLSPVADADLPQGGGETHRMIMDGYEAMWGAWSRVAEAAGEGTELAGWAGERAECARDCAARLEDALEDGDGDGSDDEGDEGYDAELDEAAFGMGLDETTCAFQGAAPPFKKGGKKGDVRGRHPRAAKEPKLKGRGK